MYVRLAFSIAIQTNPDILLLDEVLAVGDEHFQKKCMDKIEEYRQREKTIVFVSHDLGSVEKLCKKSLLLVHGKPMIIDDTKTAIDKYRSLRN